LARAPQQQRKGTAVASTLDPCQVFGTSFCPYYPPEEIIRLPCGEGSVVGPLLAASALLLRCAASAKFYTD
jgi:hypothetical protein